MLNGVAFQYKLLGLALVMFLLPIPANADLVSKDLNNTVIAVNAYRGKNKSTFSGVVVQADRNSKTEMLILVMDAAREAGVKDISISAEPL